MNTQKTSGTSNQGEMVRYEVIEKAIETGNIDQGVIKECEKFAERFSNVTTNQLRGFFGELRRIERKGFNNSKSDFNLLRPKLAYASARLKGLNDFRSSMDRFLSVVDNENKFENFMKIIEAIVAYHKFYEEENKKKGEKK